MKIIMNENMLGHERFARTLTIALPARREVDGESQEIDWHRTIKSIIKAALETEEKPILEGVFSLPNDQGHLPFLYQTLCGVLSEHGTAGEFLMALPVYDDEYVKEVDVFNNITQALLDRGIYTPFFMGLEPKDYKTVKSLKDTDNELYNVLIADLTSATRGDDVTDFYVAITNISRAIEHLKFTDSDFADENSVMIMNPMLMSAVTTDITSEFNEDIFQASAYFQATPEEAENISIDEGELD